MKRKLLVALLLCVAAVAVYAGSVSATPQSGVTTTFVTERLGLFDLYIVHNTFAPGATSGWHTHPGRSFVEVTKGQLTNYDGDNPCSPRVYSAGQGFVDEGMGHVHMLVNRTSQPAETVVVQLIAAGQPRRIDRQAPPGNCPL